MSVMLSVARTPKNDGALSGHTSGDSEECFDGGHTLETSMSEKPVISKGDPEHGDGVHPHTKSKVKHGDSISKKPVDSTQENEKWGYDRDNGHGSRWNSRGCRKLRRPGTANRSGLFGAITCTSGPRARLIRKRLQGE